MGANRHNGLTLYPLNNRLTRFHQCELSPSGFEEHRFEQIGTHWLQSPRHLGSKEGHAAAFPPVVAAPDPGHTATAGLDSDT